MELGCIRLVSSLSISDGISGEIPILPPAATCPAHPQAQSSSPSAAAGAAMTTAEFPEASIQQLTSAGFSEEEAVEELRSCGGNPELALRALWARSIKF